MTTFTLMTTHYPEILVQIIQKCPDYELFTLSRVNTAFRNIIQNITYLPSSVPYDLTLHVLNSGKYSLVTYNNKYGGGPPKLSKSAKETKGLLKPSGNDQIDLLRTVVLHERRTGEPATPLVGGVFGGDEPRRHAEFGFAIVLKEHERYVELDEYDGLETPYLQMSEKDVVAAYKRWFDGGKVYGEGKEGLKISFKKVTEEIEAIGHRGNVPRYVDKG